MGAVPRVVLGGGRGGVLRRHPLPALFACGLLLFMAVEYTIPMVRPGAPPLDLGFVATQGMHDAVAARPWLNSLLAALNTVSAPGPALPCLPNRPIFLRRRRLAELGSMHLLAAAFLSSDFQSPSSCIRFLIIVYYISTSLFGLQLFRPQNFACSISTE